MAEKYRVPLYVLSAGDLGTLPDKVESGLDLALECCQLWDAVLLLDEADVFLEKRDSNSLSRNELVSSKFDINIPIISKYAWFSLKILDLLII